MQDNKQAKYVKVRVTPYAGRMMYHYTVECSKSGQVYAAGWCESEAQAWQMAEKMQRHHNAE